MWLFSLCYCTIEPFRVVLCSPERWHPTQAAVYDGVSAREVNDCGGIQLSAFRNHRCGVMTRVIWAACHTIHPLQDAAHVAHLRWMKRQSDAEMERKRERQGEYQVRSTVFSLHSTILHTQTHTYPYLSGNTQWLESIGSTGHDLSLVHQQDSDVVLTFNLQRSG